MVVLLKNGPAVVRFTHYDAKFLHPDPDRSGIAQRCNSRRCTAVAPISRSL